MKNINIVALNGHMGSGKDTLGRHLESEYDFFPVSLAKPLYTLAEDYYYILKGQKRYFADGKLIEDEIKNYLNKIFENQINTNELYEELLLLAQNSDLINNPEKPRVFLQDAGQLLRAKQNDIFVKTLFNRLLDENEWDNTSNFVITDLRTKEEIEDFKLYAEKYSTPDTKINVIFIHILVDIDNIVLRIGQRDGVSKEFIIEHLKHKTELPIDKSYFNYVIDGNKPYISVITEVERIISEIL